MQDATNTWSSEVAISAGIAGSLSEDVVDVDHALSDLIDTISDLDTNYFPDDIEEYELLTNAQALTTIVTAGTSQLRCMLRDVRIAVNDLRRTVDFYRK